VDELYKGAPLHFIPNLGQFDVRVKFVQDAPGQRSFLTEDSLWIALEKAGEKRGDRLDSVRSGEKSRPGASIIRLSPVGMNPEVRVEAAEEDEAKVHYLRGTEPGNSITNVPTYRSVFYRGAYPGVDLRFYGSGKSLEYDIIVQAGADPGRVRFAYGGIERLHLSSEGDLLVSLSEGGELVQRKPVAYQWIESKRVEREARFVLAPLEEGSSEGIPMQAHNFHFELGWYDPDYPIVIDPVLVYSTYLGGSMYDWAEKVAVDSSGNAWIAGHTYSKDFPYLNGLFGCTEGSDASDAFVSKFNSEGRLRFSTYFAGSGADTAAGIAVDINGNAYVTGWTCSNDFATNVVNAGTPI